MRCLTYSCFYCTRPMLGNVRSRRHSWAPVPIPDVRDEYGRVVLRELSPKSNETNQYCSSNLYRRIRRHSTCDNRFFCSNSPIRARRYSVSSPISSNKNSALVGQADNEIEFTSASEWFRERKYFYLEDDSIDSPESNEFINVISKAGEKFRSFVLCDPADIS